MKNYSKESKAPAAAAAEWRSGPERLLFSLECDEVGGETGVGETLGGSRQVVDPQRSVLALPAKSNTQAINQANTALQNICFPRLSTGWKETDVYLYFTARYNRIYNWSTEVKIRL